MNQHWHAAAEYAINCLERYVTMLDPECTCEPCTECGREPADCSDTDCALTCQCNECDHCYATGAIAVLRAEMESNQTGAPRRKRRPSMAHSETRK